MKTYWPSIDNVFHSLSEKRHSWRPRDLSSDEWCRHEHETTKPFRQSISSFRHLELSLMYPPFHRKIKKIDSNYNNYVIRKNYLLDGFCLCGWFWFMKDCVYVFHVCGTPKGENTSGILLSKILYTTLVKENNDSLNDYYQPMSYHLI